MFMTMFNPFGAGAESIDPIEAVTMVKKGKAVLVDVRESAEFAGGHAKGALSIPMGQVAQKADPAHAACAPSLRKGLPVILYCASGARSGMAARVFRKLGHETVYNLGALGAWQNGGGRVVR